MQNPAKEHATGRATDEALPEEMAEALERLCAARGIPGAVVGLVDGDGAVTVATFGTANVGTGLPGRAATRCSRPVRSARATPPRR